MFYRPDAPGTSAGLGASLTPPLGGPVLPLYILPHGDTVRAAIGPAVLIAAGAGCLASAALLRQSTPSWPVLALLGTLCVAAGLAMGARCCWIAALQAAEEQHDYDAAAAGTGTGVPHGPAPRQSIQGTPGPAAPGGGGQSLFLLPVHSLYLDASSLYGRLYGDRLVAAPAGGDAALVCGVETPRGAAAAAEVFKGGKGCDDGGGDGCSSSGWDGNSAVTQVHSGPTSRDSDGEGGGGNGSSSNSRPATSGRLVVVVQPHTMMMGLQPRDAGRAGTASTAAAATAASAVVAASSARTPLSPPPPVLAIAAPQSGVSATSMVAIGAAAPAPPVLSPGGVQPLPLPRAAAAPASLEEDTGRETHRNAQRQ